MRHSLNIVVAIISMAAGAWQGTTAQTEQRGATLRHEATQTAAAVTLRGCIQKGTTAGQFLLRSPAAGTLEADSPLAPRPESRETAPPASSASANRDAVSVTYEIVAARADVDLAAIVGQRVEVQGTPERTARGAADGPAAAAVAADSSGSRAPTGTSGRSTERSRVRVSTVRPVGGTCE